MKTFIKNTNQYLLERFPTVWNTKLVWMLSVGIMIHVLFYIFGFFSLADVTLLHERNAIDNFFENGMLFFSIIITVILLVLWLIQLFKNNSFKNLYPTSRLKLFGQFFQYFIIILVCSTFYFSYIFGLKHYIDFKYADEEFNIEVERSNQAALFLSHSLAHYTIDNKKYPSPFDTIYCENKKRSFVDKSEPYLEFYNEHYQFYTLYELEFRKKDFTSISRDEYQDYVFYRDRDSLRIYYYKDEIVNIDSLGYNAKPSYFNFSDTFNSIDNYNYSYELDHYYQPKDNFTQRKKRIQRNKLNYELLTRNDSKEIKTLFKDFLSYCDIYEVNHNLSVGDWYNIINTPNFEVTKLIRRKKRDPKESFYFENERTALEKYTDSITTDFYVESDNLKEVFKNIKKIKAHTVLNKSVHVFIWLSFLFALLIYIFRVSNLRIFIFSVVTSGLLLVLTGLITALVEFTTTRQMVKSEYVLFFILLFLGTIILIIPLFYYKKLRKTLVGICMNISIFGFVFYVLLIFGIISTYQSDYCYKVDFYNYEKPCVILLEYLGFYLSIIILVLGFVFMYFYTSIIKRWMALPER